MLGHTAAGVLFQKLGWKLLLYTLCDSDPRGIWTVGLEKNSDHVDSCCFVACWMIPVYVNAFSMFWTDSELTHLL